jgi:hypothetical protein
LKRLTDILSPDIPKTTLRLKHKPGEKAFVDYGVRLCCLFKVNNFAG